MLSRRTVLRTAGTFALAAGGSAVLPRRPRAQRKQLKIMQWRHFVPSFDPWFNDVFAREWGEANDIDVVVENVGFGEIRPRALAEIAASDGHDLIQYNSPHATFVDHLIDHREIFEECAARYGEPADFAVRTHYNPTTRSYCGFAAAYQPALVTYRRDLWDGSTAALGRWSDILQAARRIRFASDKPVGLSLASEHNAEQTLRSLMYSFGSTEQDADGNPVLRSKATLDVLGFVKDLYEQSMTPDMLAWDGASNNRFMLTGEGSFTVDSLSIARAAETMQTAFATDLGLAAMPEGPAARLGSFGFYTYGIWRFAQNVDAAQRFLADLAGRSRDGFLASRFQNMPCYPATVPDLAALTGGAALAGTDAAAGDATPGATDGKYALVKDVPGWTTYVGYPGYTNPAISEAYDKGVISRMFAATATGRLPAADALDGAGAELDAIFAAWRERGKV